MPAITNAPAASTMTSRDSAVGTPSRPKIDDGALRATILETFPAHMLPRDSPVVASLVSLLRVYSSRLTAEDLYYKTEATLVSDRADHISLEIVEQVRQTIAQDWERDMGTKTAPAPVSGANGASASSSSVSQTPSKGIHVVSTPGSKHAHHQQQHRAALGSFLGISPRTPATPLDGDKRLVRAGHQLSSAASGSPAPSRRNAQPMSGVSPSSSSSSLAPHIVETLNPHITSVGAGGRSVTMDLDGDAHDTHVGATKHSRVALAIGTDPRTWNYRYMFERPGTKGHALDDQIEAITETILQTYNVADEDLADPSTPSQESVYVVGRIAPNVSRDQKAGKVGYAKLSEGIVLETSRRIGSGSRTPVMLASNVKVRPLIDAAGQQVRHSSSTGEQIGLFPGLIAGFRGRNGGGEAFIIEEILMPPPLPPAATAVEDLLKHQHEANKLNGEPLQVMVASGPFTNEKDLDFRPWHRFMDHVEQQLPDVVLLLGPFLPTSNAALSDPELVEMPQAIFERHISRRLNGLCEKTARTSAILLPSTRDIVSPHAAWPQPMLDKVQLGLHKRVKCLPNPCLFSVNEVIIGASTADVLRDVRAEELVVDLADAGVQQQSSKGNERDAMARNVRHLLNQRHFYPLYPASTASEVPLDVSHAKLAAFTHVSPDMLLLPSILSPFAKVVDGVVVVNPGPAARGSGQASTTAATTEMTSGTGTFIKLQVQAMSKDVLLNSQEQAVSSSEGGDGLDGTQTSKLQHGLYERTRVDILRF